MATYLLVALGVVHAALTVQFYDGLSVDAVWFLGTGMALSFLGLINATAAASNAGRARWTCRIANVAGLGLGLLAVIAVREPQAYFGVVLIGLLTATSFFLPRQTA